MKILIADDSVQMRESLKRFLLKRIPNHHTILEAADGSEAVTLYDRFAPDWVLMDVEMKPMDGFTATRAILSTHPFAKIIVVTGFDNISYRDTAKETGALAYVMKSDLAGLEAVLLSKSSES